MSSPVPKLRRERSSTTSIQPSLPGRRGIFPGPAESGKPEWHEDAPRAPAAPPSRLLPTIPATPRCVQHSPEGQRPEVPQATPNFRKRWDVAEGIARDGHGGPHGMQRDHHRHVGFHRQPSAWQRQLRRQQRERFQMGETENVALQAQLTRLHAFKWLRNAAALEDGTSLLNELELGSSFSFFRDSAHEKRGHDVLTWYALFKYP